jgi:hypothetical protein
MHVYFYKNIFYFYEKNKCAIISYGRETYGRESNKQ